MRSVALATAFVMLVAAAPLAAPESNTSGPTAAFITPVAGDVILYGDRTPGVGGPAVAIGEVTIVIGGSTPAGGPGLASLELFYIYGEIYGPRPITRCEFEDVSEGTCAFTYDSIGDGISSANLKLVAVATDEAGATSRAELEFVWLEASLADHVLMSLGHNPYD